MILQVEGFGCVYLCFFWKLQISQQRNRILDLKHLTVIQVSLPKIRDGFHGRIPSLPPQVFKAHWLISYPTKSRKVLFLLHIKNKGSDLGSAQIQKTKHTLYSKQDAWDKLEGQWVTDSRVYCSPVVLWMSATLLWYPVLRRFHHHIQVINQLLPFLKLKVRTWQ